MLMTLCLMVYAAIQHRIRYEQAEPCILKPEKKALPEPNGEMGVFLFSRVVFRCINDTWINVPTQLSGSL